MNQPSRIIDADVHNTYASPKDLLPYLSSYWQEQVKRVGLPVAALTVRSPIGVSREDARPPGGGPAGSDPAFLKKHHLDTYGIDYAILTGGGILSISLWPDLDFCNAVAAAYNDWMAEKWLKFSPQYKGCILINHGDPPAAAKEIDRWGSHPDMVQVIMASGARMPFGHRFYHPIYEAAERHGLPVAIHPGTEGAGIAEPPTPAGYPSRYFEWHNILPLNYMGHLNSLVCEGVFEKFPKLKFVCIEGGIAWLPHLMWRMDKNYKALRSTTPWLKRLPSEYIKEHIRLTTQPIEEPDDPRQLTQIFEMIEGEKLLMFSTDYPHWDFDSPKMALPPMSKEMKQRIMWQNAAELYGLSEAPVAAESGGNLDGQHHHPVTTP